MIFSALTLTFLLLQSPKPALRSATVEVLPSIVLENTTYADALATISKKWNINIVSDVYVTELPVKSLRLEKIEPTNVVSALRELAAVSDRTTQHINGIYVLRTRTLPHRLGIERFNLQNTAIRWANSGQIVVRRLVENKVSLTPVLSRVQEDSLTAAETIFAVRDEAEKQPKRLLPAKLLSLDVKSASMMRVAEQFSQVSGHSLSFGNALSERRIIAQISAATAGQIIEALTFLTNARQRTVIEQTDNQLALEAESLDDRGLRVKLSDVLRKKLAPLLTAEQKAKLGSEEVSLKVKDLPADIQKMALDYMRSSCPTGMTLDSSRLMDFDIVFLPPPSVGLGVNGWAEDIGKIGY